MISRVESWVDIPLESGYGSPVGCQSLFHDNHEKTAERAVNSTVLIKSPAVSLPLNDCPAKITTIIRNVRAREASTNNLRKVV